MLQVILKNLLGLIKYSEIQNHQKKKIIIPGHSSKVHFLWNILAVRCVVEQPCRQYTGTWKSRF